MTTKDAKLVWRLAKLAARAAVNEANGHLWNQVMDNADKEAEQIMLDEGTTETTNE